MLKSLWFVSVASLLLISSTVVSAEGEPPNRQRASEEGSASTEEASRKVENSVYLGVFTVPLKSIHARIRDGLRLSGDAGVVIAEVLPDSPAADAGMREKDVITHVNGKPIVDQADLCRRLNRIGAGKTAHISVLRRGDKQVFLPRLKYSSVEVVTFLPYGGANRSKERPSSMSQRQRQRIEELEREVARLEQRLREMEEASLARRP